MRPVKAGIYAAQVVAALLGCKLEQAAEHWLDVALRPAETPLFEQERALEERLVNVTAYVSAYCHLINAGHPPEAILKAVAGEVQSNHNLFDCPNLVPLFQAAAERWRARPSA